MSLEKTSRCRKIGHCTQNAAHQNARHRPRKLTPALGQPCHSGVSEESLSSMRRQTPGLPDLSFRAERSRIEESQLDRGLTRLHKDNMAPKPSDIRLHSRMQRDRPTRPNTDLNSFITVLHHRLPQLLRLKKPRHRFR